MKRSEDYFFRGLGAEFVFKTSDGISIVSGGRVLKVRMETAEGEPAISRIVLVEADLSRHVVFEGSALDTAARFVEIGNIATTPRTRVAVSRRGLYAALAAFTAVYLVFCHPSSRSVDTATISAASELGSLLKDIPALARSGAPGLNIPGGVVSPVPTGLPSVAPVSTIVDKPSFLALPEEAASEEASTKPSAEPSDVAAIPSYSADLYKAAPATSDPVSSKPAAPEQKPAAATAAALPAPKAQAESADAKEKQSSQAAAADAKQPAPAAKDTDAAKAEAPSKPDATETAVATPASPEDAKAIAANATKGMTATDTAALLKQIEQMMAMDPTSITPDMLSKLPHDIAQALRDTGVLDNPAAMPEKGDAPYAAIRLPAGVIDKFRGKDGIASIPENDTYAALGNRIPLQLPGGGDIRKPEDLELFGFKP